MPRWRVDEIFRRNKTERYGGERNNFQIIPTLFSYSFEQVGDLKEMHLSLSLTDLVFSYFYLKKNESGL